MNAVPTLAFLFAHPAHFIALGAGSGLARVGPGTFGTLVAVPLALALEPLGDAMYLVAAIALFAAGWWSASVAGRALGDDDDPAIVIDEVAAFFAMLFFVGVDPLRMAIAFVLFRAFDIVKPPPIREVERRMTGGLGTMLDDVLAAFYALVVFAIIERLFL